MSAEHFTSSKLLKVAESALQLVATDPLAAMAKAEDLIESGCDGLALIVALRAAGLAARLTRPMSQSVDYLERAFALASTGHELARAQTALSLGGSYAFAGRVDEAVALLEAERPDSGIVAAHFDFQRAMIAGRAGESHAALAAFDQVVPQAREAGEAEQGDFLAHALGNRGRALMDLGMLDRAERDIGEAMEIRHRLGQDVAAAYLLHNLGEVSLLKGDLQLAMKQLAESEQVLTRLTDSPWEPQVVRGDALLLAGLAQEAADLAKRLVNLMSTAGLSLDVAEAQLLRARALQRLGDLEGAQQAAAEAETLCAAQNRKTWVYRCQLIAMMCEGDPRRRLRIAQELVDRLTDDEAPRPLLFEALAVAVRAALEAGELDQAEQLFASLQSSSGRGFERELIGATLQALIAAARSDRRLAFSSIRKALSLAENHQASLAAIEFIMSSTWNVAEIAGLGVLLANNGGDSKTIFRYVERARASALRIRSVRPPADAEIASLSASVRTLARTMANDPAKVSQREFQRALTRLRNVERARGRATSQVTNPSELDDVKAALGHRLMISLFIDRGRLWAQQITATRATKIDLGSIDDIRSTFSRLRRLLNSAARGVTGATSELDQLVQDSTLASALQPPGDGEVILIPPPELLGAPWLVLPGLRNRPVTISPSASSWQRCDNDDRPVESTAAVAGPGLAHATAEAAAIAQVHNGKLLIGEAATCSEVTALFESSDMLHVACHARHRVGNALFSALELSDGPLMVLDLDRLARSPKVVVLSSCHAGQADHVGAAEMLGLTTIFLRAGASSVIAGSGLVPDSERTVKLMTRFHQELQAGKSPSYALLAARSHPDADLVDTVAFALYGGSPTTA